MSDKLTSFYKNKEISCGDQVLRLDQPKIMGIINLTNDSFFDGGRYNKGEKYLYKAAEMIDAGAHILDIGAVSTRPGAPLIAAKKEWEILEKPLQNLKRNFPQILISVDTYNASLIKKCAHLGVNIINDVSGGSWDSQMFNEIAQYQMAYILMHIKGKPENMQDAPQYHAITQDVFTYFEERIGMLEELNFHQIILDPGFGFGKSLDHNFQLLAQLKRFEKLNYPLLAGLSRKSMIFKPLHITPEKALNGTTVLNTLALYNGARILRVHDIREAFETIELFSQYNEGLKSKE
ncbi:MAG: dihydropteroate synthase [Bacteroidales bacterium]|nr:dihydropteroate synthase [Bacteroidales bacterium]